MIGGAASCLPTNLGCVWTGVSRTPPELLALALSSRDNPFRIRTMSENERDAQPTLAPETDREAATNPEASRQPLLPPANPYAGMPDWWEGSYFQSIFNDVRSAAQAITAVTAGQDAILDAIRRADANQTANYNLLRDEIRHLKDSDLKQDQRLKEGDARFDKIEQSIAALKLELIGLVEREMKAAAEKIEALEQLLAEARSHVTRPSTPTTA